MDWREQVVNYIREAARPVDKFGHQPRLYRLACQLAETEPFDDDVLFAAAWMHDLGVFLGHRPEDLAELARWNHVPYTVEKTAQLLSAWGFPKEKIEPVAAAIRTHQPLDQPTSFEAILLHDADILEQLGAIGILRAVVKVGRDTRYPSYSQVRPVLERALAELPEKLHLSSARRAAEPRLETLNAFLTSLTAEADDELN